MGKRIKADFLFAQPSFMTGIASAFDLTGGLTEYTPYDTRDEANRKALLSDWFVTGQDIQDAIEQFSVHE